MPTKPAAPRPQTLCNFPFADGRTCRFPLSPTHPDLCVFHARHERRLLESESIAAELSSLFSQIRTFHDLNLYLTRLAFFTAAGRLPKSTCKTLAFLGALILQTIPSVKNEIRIAHGHNELEALLRRTIPNATAHFCPDADFNAAADQAAPRQSHEARTASPAPIAT
jgi:hypothetical protein